MASGTRITTTGVLYINGQQVENTFNNVSRITRRLEQELRRLPPGTREFIETAEQLRRARARLQEVRDEIDNVTNSTQRATGFLGFFRNGIIQLGETFRQVFTADLASRFFDLIISKGKETVDELLKIADAMTDVQKTSGMSLEQVKELWDAFDEMDTRTSKLDRLKIAEVGGRLGVPINQMKSFVQEIDKAYVALGDSFEGGLEGVVEQLGKIKNLFNTTKEMDYAEAINRVGSALNVLAAQGVASEGNISQFAMRVGTLPDALKPAIDKVLGLGAAFEESGIDAQIASSGFSNFMTTAGENISAFAYSMHMSKKEAQDLINTKPEEFFLRFAQGMKGLSATQTAKVLESLKLNSLEVQKAVGAAANNTDKFRESMKTAAVEMDKMTSLQDEFNQKNNNAPAIIDKLKNAWNDIFTYTNVMNKFEWLIKAIGWLTGVTKEAGDGVIEFKERLLFLGRIITVLIASVIGYNTALAVLALTTKSAYQQTLLYTIIQKAKIAIDTIAKGATLLYAAAMAILEGNTVRATAALRLFNTVTKANAIGLLVAAITAAATAYIVFSSRVDEATKKQKLLNEINTTAQKATIDQKLEVEKYVKIARDDNATREAKIAAIKRLNEISPIHLGHLTLENIKTKEATKSINEYVKALNQKAMAEALSSKRAELFKKQIDIQGKGLEDYDGFWNLWGVTRSGDKKSAENEGKKGVMTAEEMKALDAIVYVDVLNQKLAKYGNTIQIAYRKHRDEMRENFKDIQSLNKIQNDFDKQNPIISTDTSTGPTNIAAPDKPKKNREANKAANDAEKSKDAYNKAIEAKTAADKVMLELQRTYEDEKSKIIGVAYTNELNLAKAEYTRQKEDLQTKTTEIKNDINKTLTEIDKLTRDKNETKSPEAKKSFDSTISELTKVNEKRQNLISKNKEIEEQLEKTYQFNLQKIRIEWETKAFERFVQNEQLRIDKIRSSDEEEIIAISSLTEAKVKLKNNEYLKLTDLELQNIQSLEDAKTALREVADRKMLKAQLESMQLQKAIMMEDIKKLSGPAADKLKEDLAALEIKITQLKSAIQGGKDKDKDARTAEQKNAMNQTDILGFSAAEWEKTWKDLDTTEGKIMAVGMAMKALGNAGQMYAQLQQNLNERELRSFTKNQEKKKKELLKQLNEGYINNEEYQKQMELLQVEMANKKAELEYRQAKADKTARMFSIIGDTAAAIATALKAGPIIGPILAGIVGAMGAVQLGIVSSQPLPERQSFDTGGYTGNGFGTPDSSGYKPAGIVHENEWVAPEWMLYNPQTARIIDYLETVRQGKTSPYAEGGKTTDTKTSDTSINPGIMQMDPQLVYVLSQISDFLEYLKNNGVDAWVIANEANGKEMKKAIESYDKIRNGAKAR
ncbi:phage tail tape measure protein [Elizabethkingia anophelis]|uniref:phage tail tape measure protein n=1 Tax=Elizabethkingia anophelis TaxID=1117645 RepID=UPI0029832456|nr:phage tail tape measure protein [Elizabethkingia anophelis]HAY3533721.1 phage tail tape measure protein [Elizabethkingia anophelis]HAY3545837.1 phage tail tape measure protein [Elizabethkingia anophelis]HAY3590663.1 phage tail tape measure protein [Elizabethkingia anophelis]